MLRGKIPHFTRVQGRDFAVGYNNELRVPACGTVFVSSRAVHCFVLVVELMFRNGVAM